MMLPSNGLNSPTKGITFRSSLLPTKKHPITLYPGNLIIPQRAFKTTFQPEQMFNSNLGKITGCWTPRTFRDCPSQRRMWQVNGWATLVCSPKQGGYEFHRDGGANLWSGPPTVPILDSPASNRPAQLEWRLIPVMPDLGAVDLLGY